MHSVVLVMLGMNAVVAADARAGKAVKSDVRQLQGTWVLVSYVRDGKSIPRRVTGEVQLLVDGYRWSATREGFGFPVEGIYQVDPTHRPKAIDITFANSIDEGKIWQGIYQLQGDRLTVCLPHLGKARPTTFVKKWGFDLEVWERKKAEAGRRAEREDVP